MSQFERVLKDAGVPTTEDAIKTEFKQVIADSGSQIANDSRYSPFWRIVSGLVIKPTLWLIQELLIKRVMPQFFLKTVDGNFIELWGDSYGVTWKQAQVMDGLVLFMRDDVSVALEIPEATKIWTDEINGTVYELLTTETVVLKVGFNGVGVRVKAVAAGAGYNLEAGYYRHCDINGLTVENVGDWITRPGADKEGLEEYRQRIRNAFNSLSHYHTDGVYRMLISEFAGVSTDMIWFEHNAPRGAGTANAYVLFPLDAPHVSYLQKINRMISDEGHHGHGDDLQVFNMPETHHNLTATVYLPTNLLDAEKAEILAGMGQAIDAAFRSNSAYVMTQTRPFSRFSFTRLAAEIYSIFPDIESISFDLEDIVSEMSVPRLGSLQVLEG